MSCVCLKVGMMRLKGTVILGGWMELRGRRIVDLTNRHALPPLLPPSPQTHYLWAPAYLLFHSRAFERLFTRPSTRFHGNRTQKTFNLEALR